MTTIKKASDQTQRFKYVEGPHYTSCYTNNISYAISAVDFVFIFGEIINASSDEVVVEQRARVTMTPVQAKIMAMILQEQIGLFENKSGEIKIPMGMTEE